MSFSEGGSVNDCIDPALCTVHYTIFDEAIHMILDMGRRCVMAKTDVKCAFRLLPIQISEFDQPGFKFEDQYFD